MDPANSSYPAIHVYLICPAGTEEAARRIASTLAPEANSITLVCSDERELAPDEKARWVTVPRDWLQGSKFLECVRLHPGGIMLQIKADAYADDWLTVIRRCCIAHRDHPNLGLWSPEIEHAPWSSELISTGTRDKDGLRLVALNAGIVWSLSERIVRRLLKLDKQTSTPGWCIDWLAACHARIEGLLVVRDARVTVRYQGVCDYGQDMGEHQMAGLLPQMTSQELEQYEFLKCFVRQRLTVHPIPASSGPAETTMTTSGSTPEAPRLLMEWPSRRASEINERLRKLAGRSRITYAFHSGIPPSIYRYFPEGQDAELTLWSPDPFHYVSSSDFETKPDVVIVTAHGNDLHRELWELRSRCGTDPIIIAWLWDNHTGYMNNKSVALAADLVMPSHADTVDYLFNPVSAISSHVPACSAQWTRVEAEGLFAEHGTGERKSKLLVNYVEYAYAPVRNSVIQNIRESIPEADVLLMPSSDRSRYFGGSPAARFREWAQYKTTIILPVTQDLSTRFFDALIAGLIPIVPTLISDLERTIAPDVLDSLGVVRINSYDIDEIQAATREAMSRFDQMGLAGAVARHRFALEHHMLVNRITQILHTVFMYADARLLVTFNDGPFGMALYQNNASCG